MLELKPTYIPAWLHMAVRSGDYRKKLPSIKVRPTALALPMTLTFNPLRTIVMICSHENVQGQRSVGSEEQSGNKRTDRQTDGGNRITSVANAVGSNESK